jgi:hypothetical protein
MTHRYVLSGPAVLMCVAAVAPVWAQTEPAPSMTSASRVEALPHAVFHGVVRDDFGQPVAGAVVSALGTTSVRTVSDSKGRFAFGSLPEGPYLVRAGREGYLPARASLVRVSRDAGATAALTLTARGSADEPPRVLNAGVGPVDSGAPAESGSDDADHDHGEVSWRLRHLKRSVLKDASTGLLGAADANDSFADSLSGLGRVASSPTRLAASLFAAVPWRGEFDLLTTTSFDRPEDLLSMQTWLPRGVAFIALEAPAEHGDWTMRGALTQGDLSSWIVAGSYRRAPAAHRYDAGVSYGVQRYLGGNRDALAATSDGARNASSVYAYDDWTVVPRLSLSYGAKYARYDYLAERALFSPRAGVTLTPVVRDSLKIRATVARRELAPGADEFTPRSTGVSLPPERTFSSVSPHGFVAERIDHTELSAEREWAGQLVTGVRVFRQTVDDQILTLFGDATTGAPRGLGHYYVASAGDFEANGWGVSVSRTVPGRVRASVDYTSAEATWAPPPVTEVLVGAAIARIPSPEGRMHDLTTSVESTMPLTDTRVLLIYKINSRFADESGTADRVGSRFDLQLNQSLPFMRFSGAEWEMLVALRSLFRDDLLDASIYDELLVVRSPKRVVGGVTVRF